MPELVCKQCGAAIVNGTKYATYKLSATLFLPDLGDCTTDRFPLDAGTFCSCECAMRYLMGQTGLKDALSELNTAIGDVRAALHILTGHVSGRDRVIATSLESIMRLGSEGRDRLDTAWGEIERILGNDSRLKPQPSQPAGPDCDTCGASDDECKQCDTDTLNKWRPKEAQQP